MNRTRCVLNGRGWGIRGDNRKDASLRASYAVSSNQLRSYCWKERWWEKIVRLSRREWCRDAAERQARKALKDALHRQYIWQCLRELFSGWWLILLQRFKIPAGPSASDRVGPRSQKVVGAATGSKAISEVSLAFWKMTMRDPHLPTSHLQPRSPWISMMLSYVFLGSRDDKASYRTSHVTNWAFLRISDQ